VSQQDPFGPTTGPLQSPPPPPHGGPGWEQPGYPAAGSPPPGYDYGHDLGPQRTNVMAILGLVFAFVFSPLGIVFSAIGLGQVRKRGEKGRGLALTGLILSILFVLIGVLVVVVAFSSPSFRAALDSARASASSAAAGASGAPSSAPAAGGGTGVAAACQTIVPALMNLEADMQDVRTPAQYSQALSKLESTLSTAASGASDQRFQQDVAQLNADLAKAAAAVQSGKDPSSLESALDADGQALGEACASAGVTG
jgi:Domain of unknown function (DUF4190)